MTVRLPSMLRKYASDAEHLVGSGPTVIAVLRAVVAAHPDLGVRLLDEAGNVHPHLAVFHQDELVERGEQHTHPVADGDRLEVIIGITGGAEDGGGRAQVR